MQAVLGPPPCPRDSGAVRYLEAVRPPRLLKISTAALGARPGHGSRGFPPGSLGISSLGLGGRFPSPIDLCSRLFTSAWTRASCYSGPRSGTSAVHPASQAVPARQARAAGRLLSLGCVCLPAFLQLFTWRGSGLLVRAAGRVQESAIETETSRWRAEPARSRLLPAPHLHPLGSLSFA